MQCPFCVDARNERKKEMEEDAGFDPVTNTVEISFECGECGAVFEGILKKIEKIIIMLDK